MTTYYVDYVNGADANNGLGPDASHSTNKPWKTLTKALGAAGIASGDTVYMSPAGPFRETVTVNMTSAVAETFVIGDCYNAQGFKTSGGVRVTPGPVILTAYTTNDKTAPAAASTITTNARDHLTFRNLIIVGGNAVRAINGTATTATDIKFEDCEIHPFKDAAWVDLTTVFGTSLNWTFDRCVFGPTSSSPAMTVNAPTGSGSDYDLGVTIKNCLVIAAHGTRGFRMVTSGASAQKPGGFRIWNTSMIIGTEFFSISSANGSTTIPCEVYNCYMRCSGTALTSGAGSPGPLVEDYNIIEAGTRDSQVTDGAHSISNDSYSAMYCYGQERIWGLLPRSLGEPMAGSAMLGFGNNGSQSAYDLRNKIRPAGGASALPAVGAMERGNTAVVDSSPIDGGIVPFKITGPGYAEFIVPVTASAISISVTVKWDATYAGTKPQFQIDGNGRIGVTAETKTATGSSGSNETLTLSTFTPTAAGDFVMIRVISNDTNGGGLLQVDNFRVA